MKLRPIPDEGTRGCDYCASDDNMYYGHVEQVGSSESTHTLLLRCPQCGWLYETSARVPKDATRIDEDDARLRFDYLPS